MFSLPELQQERNTVLPSSTEPFSGELLVMQLCWTLANKSWDWTQTCTSQRFSLLRPENKMVDSRKLRRKRASQEKMWPEKQIQLTMAGREPEHEFLPEGILPPTFQGLLPVLIYKLYKSENKGTVDCVNVWRSAPWIQSQTRDWKNNSTGANRRLLAQLKQNSNILCRRNARNTRACCASFLIQLQSLEST